VKPRWKHWARALLVVPLLLFALTASSRLEVRCALTGLLVPDCCLGTGPAPAPPQQQASIGGRDCCERTLVANDKLLAAGPEASLDEAPLPVGRVVPEPAAGVFASLQRSGNPLWRACLGPARASAPAPFLLTHAFLI
jgi:hypothetical protein